MSAYLLLTDKNICPACRVRRQFVTAPCHNCGAKLFTSGNFNFEKYELEVGCHWWAYDKFKGWCHRDHWMVKDIAPNVRRYTPPVIEKNYGLQAPERGGKKIRVKR